MGFESLHIDAPGVDRVAAEAWLAAQEEAILDPHGTGAWHLSGRASEARRAHAARVATPTRFSLGVVVRFTETGLTLEARADREALAVARDFLQAVVPPGAVMRRDWSNHEAPFSRRALFGAELPDTVDRDQSTSE